MDDARLTTEVETGARFEIFYALHKLFAPASSLTAKWRAAAREKLGAPLENEAKEIAPDPLMWAVLADSTLATRNVSTFDDVIRAIEQPSAEDFRTTVVGGIPDVPGSALAGHFHSLLRDPRDYRRRLISVLREFWSGGFSDDLHAIKPELDRMARQLHSVKASAPPATLLSRLSLPLELDESRGALRARRGGYEVPLSRVGRIVLLPSAFNLNRWWTKRDDGESPVDFFFPLNDGTISPNDAAAHHRTIASRAEASGAPVDPALVFRALGDTTRYAIATILARSPSTPSEIARQLKVSKPTITHHVHALRGAGLIVEGTDGGKLALDRSALERLSSAAVSTLFSAEGKLRLSKTRKR